MTVHPQEPGQGAKECSRKRKPHKKSMRGCRNCKLRRVKCDEIRPECKKCIAFGVTCNYDTKTPDLQMSLGRGAPAVIDNLANKVHAHKVAAKKPPTAFTNPAIFGQGVLHFSAILPPSFASESILLDKDSLGLLDRFKNRTISTLGTSRTAPIYKDVSIREAFAHPYLMHIVLTLTSIHDRFLSPVPNRKPTITELYHWTEGASLLNKKLSSPWPPEARDSLWTAAALLGAIAFSNVEAAGPEEAWPLKEADSGDLEWLRMSDGKQIIWQIADPLRPESAFHALATELINDQIYVDTTYFKYEDVPQPFLSLFEIDEASTQENNPYFSAIRILSTLLHEECNHSTIAKYLSFMSQVTKSYKRLLEQKDPRALLLLVYWFGKVCNGVWWVRQRALMEGQATCLYLEKFHSHETAIMDLLDFPKRELGLLV